MKITKKRLQEIILEEMALAEQEQLPDIERVAKTLPRVDNFNEAVALLKLTMQHISNVDDSRIKTLLLNLHKQLPTLVKSIGQEEEK